MPRAVYQDRVLRNLPCEKIQADEQWGFVGCKQRNRETAKNFRPGMGDAVFEGVPVAAVKLFRSTYDVLMCFGSGLPDIGTLGWTTTAFRNVHVGPKRH